MLPAPGVKLTLAEVAVILLTATFVTGGQVGNASVVNVVVAAVEVWPAPQLLATLTVYRVAGVSPARATGELVGAGVTAVAVPPCGVYVMV
jgi:hypothetical protein